MIHDVLKGCIIGFSTAMPIGSIGVLCIRRTLAGGFLCGVISGSGSATVDALYSAIASLSIVAIQQFLLHYQKSFQILSGLLLCSVGYCIARTLPGQRSMDSATIPFCKYYFSTFLLTLTDPLPILFFMVLLAGISNEQNSAQPIQPFLFSLGVFSGSMAWWLSLSSFCHVFRTKILISKLQWINRISGGTIASFGCVMLGKAIGL
jgi:threonine/homoserine/homoserine lactone efflux protein